MHRDQEAIQAYHRTLELTQSQSQRVFLENRVAVLQDKPKKKAERKGSAEVQQGGMKSARIASIAAFMSFM